MASRSYFGPKTKPKRDNFKGKKGKFRKKQIYSTKDKTWKTIDEEISQLKEKYSQINVPSLEKFADFPLSKKTLEGLKFAKYEEPTEIQKASIGLALQGSDILGAAKTGSGKTLAFLIPVLECLFRQKWSALDGLGALIISPTRELAYQTFEVLRKIGKFHDFSAGLVIGGKLLKEEIGRINKTNIVICTPGRLLQHMDETVNFTADSLQILVLDEADRILDLGFAQTMNAVIENLPPTRQTLLFSATQTKSVKDLARLSLSDPMYVSVHENAKHSTPTQLEQNYIVCELHDKISMLWSFLKNHLKSKILVFLQSCKQVKYVHECLRRLRPGVTVLALHGAMHQLKRVAVYNQFCRKKNAVLFATDIAARGLDFPAVNWVVQLDCPEDANTYIHRAGRTARYKEGGQSLLVLLPSEEEAMIKQLQDKKIPVERIKVNPKKLWSIQPKLESNCAADPSLKEFAQRAFLSYLRSVFMMSNKKVFNIHKLDTDKFSSSLGLAVPPRVRFLKREEKRQAERNVSEAKKKVSNKSTPLKPELQKSDSEGDLQSDSNSESSDEESESEDDLNPNRTSDLKNVSNIQKKSKTSETESDSESEHSEESDSESEHLVGSDSENEHSKGSDSESVSDNTEKNGDSGVLRFGVEDDDNDLFTVKKSDIKFSDDDQSEDEKKMPVHKKPNKQTKFALAKKLQKKNVKVNTKVMFDEEGEAIVDVLKNPHVKDDTDELSGINVMAAKQRMLEEDKFDKQLYRERVRQKHREERLKKREEKRARKKRNAGQEDSEEEVQVVLGGGDEEEQSDDLEDSLQDLRQLYEDQIGSASDEEDDETEDESDDDIEPTRKKQRLAYKEKSNDEEEDEDDDDDEEEDGNDDDDEEEEEEEQDMDMKLADVEELAFKLLRS